MALQLNYGAMSHFKYSAAEKILHQTNIDSLGIVTI